MSYRNLSDVGSVCLHAVILAVYWVVCKRLELGHAGLGHVGVGHALLLLGHAGPACPSSSLLHTTLLCRSIVWPGVCCSRIAYACAKTALGWQTTTGIGRLIYSCCFAGKDQPSDFNNSSSSSDTTVRMITYTALHSGAVKQEEGWGAEPPLLKVGG